MSTHESSLPSSLLSLPCLAALAALLLGAAPAAPPAEPGTYRRAVPADDGVRIATYLYVPERLKPADPLLVLLPDLGATHHFFEVGGRGLARDLVERGFLVATLDWRGTGLSEAPARPAGLDDLLLRDLPAAVAAVGAGRPVVLVGWGYAGALAYAAAAGPLAARVVGVVTLDGVVDLDVPNPLVAHLLEGANGPLDLGRGLAQSVPNRKGSLFELLWMHGGHLEPSLAGPLLAALAPLSAPQVQQLRAWMKDGQTTLGGKPYPALLADLKAPVLALDGLLDNWTHPEFAATVRDRLPRDQVQVYPVSRFEGFADDVGHVGLVLGPVCEKELVPLIVEFARAKAAPVEAAR